MQSLYSNEPKLVLTPPPVIIKDAEQKPEIVFRAKLSDGRIYTLNDSFFNYNYIPYLNCHDRYQLFCGSYGSGKSQFAISRIVLDVVFNNRNYVCVRQYKADIERSIYNEILDMAERMGLRSLFYETKNPFKILCLATGRSVDFFGLDDPARIKSYKPAKGVLTDIYVEEATEIQSKRIFEWLDSRLRGIDSSLPLEKQPPARFTMCFNPEGGTEHWIFKDFFLGRFTQRDWEKRYRREYDREAAFRAIQSSSPHLSENEINTIINWEIRNYNVMILRTVHDQNRFLKVSDHIRYSGYDGDQKTVGHLGWWASSGDMVFKEGVHWHTEDLSKWDFINPKHGLDFGYDPDPFAYVHLDFDKKKKLIYVVQALDDTCQTNPEIAQTVFPYALREPVNCDSAEKKSIEELKSRRISGGFALNARAVRKASGRIGKTKLGYVEFKIQWMKQYHMIVDKRLKGVIAELSSYARKRNKNGELTNSFTGTDHYIDAISYALNDEMFNTSNKLITSYQRPF